MSTETPRLKFKRGNLKDIASDIGQPYMPGAQLTFIDGHTLDVSPQGDDGTLWFALKDNDNNATLQIDGNNTIDIGMNRAYIFLDANTENSSGNTQTKRYAITGPVYWSEIYDTPLSRIASNLSYRRDSKKLYLVNLNNEEISSNVQLPFVLLEGDTMTGPLSIAHDSSNASQKATLSYNDITQSLDFTFN